MCIFFFKQKTAYEMRISDWSSDVCSSDLPTPTLTEALAAYDAWCKLTGRDVKKHPPQNLWSSEDVYFLLKHWVDETIDDMPQWLQDALEEIIVDRKSTRLNSSH